MSLNKKKLFYLFLSFFFSFLSLFFRKRKELKGVKNILVVKLEHLGDVLLATSAIRTLKEKYPQAKLSVIAGSWAKEVLEDNPFVDEIIFFDLWRYSRFSSKTRIPMAIGTDEVRFLKEKEKWVKILKELFLLRKKLYQKKFDLAVCFNERFSPLLITYLSGAKYRLGYDWQGRGFFLTHKVFFPDSGKKLWEIDRCLEIVKTIEEMQSANLGRDAKSCVSTIDRRHSLMSPIENETKEKKPIFIFKKEDENFVKSLLNSNRVDGSIYSNRVKESVRASRIDENTYSNRVDGNTCSSRVDGSTCSNRIDENTCSSRRVDGSTCSHLPCLIIIHPGAPWSARRWPKERFAKISDFLIENYKAKVIFIGASEEKNLVSEIAKLVKHSFLDLTGKLTLKQLGALIKKADLFIGNDSFPAHLAGALEIPLIVLFGPGDHIRWRPYGEKTILLRKEISCSPCRQNLGDQKCEKGFSCCLGLENISIEEVKAQIQNQFV